jgi:hypothetical protein
MEYRARIGQFIDRHNGQFIPVRAFIQSPQYATANSAVAIDSQPYQGSMPLEKNVIHYRNDILHSKAKVLHQVAGGG